MELGIICLDPKSGLSRASLAESSLRERRAITPVAVNGQRDCLLDFWCELRLQSVKKRKVSGYPGVAIFEQCKHTFNSQWMGKEFLNTYYAFLNAEAAAGFFLTLSRTAPALAGEPSFLSHWVPAVVSANYSSPSEQEQTGQSQLNRCVQKQEETIISQTQR